MAVLSFPDLLQKAGLNPEKVKLIRHSMTDKGFKACYDADKVYDYTCHQKPGFSRGYDYWAVFIGGSGTTAVFHALYKVNGSVPETLEMVQARLVKEEVNEYSGNYVFFNLEHSPLLQDYEDRLTIDWGKSTLMWHQKGTREKPIIFILPDKKKAFPGFEDLILTYDELRKVITTQGVYDAWRVALSSVNAIYLIVDTETGKQYVGSAYGNDGLWGRWSCYVDTLHGNNKQMKDLICNYPERYHSFQFSVLQILPKTMTAEEVVAVEARYKKKLLSIPFGMNEN